MESAMIEESLEPKTWFTYTALSGSRRDLWPIMHK
jgi:hypothetical protein